MATSSDKSLTAPATQELSELGLRAFFAIAARWNLSTDEGRRLLGEPSATMFLRMKRHEKGVLTRAQLERISYVLGIYRSLQLLFADPVRADAWIKTPNAAPCCEGRTALDRMLGDDVAGLRIVRDYLYAQLEGRQ